jgi:bifunctional enzyme CysN/CysC
MSARQALKAPAAAGAAAGAAAVAVAIAPQRELAGIVRVLTCGSVDDGKSTLIGRMLWDGSDLFDDQRETLRKSDRRVLDGKHLDYSLLVDGLIAERAQGITIDIAWRTFDTAKRRFVIIDSPGHEQYTRNMASGASHADVAIMLVDARSGIKRQTRRHAAILDLFGVRRVVLAVNKMDLVGWSETRFRAIEADFTALQRRFGFDAAVAIPVASVTGDNIVHRSTNMPWYAGPALLAHLDQVPSAATQSTGAFRMPVQSVLRDGQDFRGLAGSITSGKVRVGDSIIDAVSKREARIARIATMSGDLQEAQAGQAVALVLDRDLDISRGAVLANAQGAPTPAGLIETRLVWLSEQAFDVGKNYLLRTATDLVPVARLGVQAHLDLETLARAPASSCAVNDIVVAEIELARPTALDTFAVSQATGSFVLVDTITGATVAGGVVTAIAGANASVADGSVAARDGAVRSNVVVLSRKHLASGVCADLEGQAGTEGEFRRRAGEVVKLLQANGVAVRLDLESNS